MTNITRQTRIRPAAVLTLVLLCSSAAIGAAASAETVATLQLRHALAEDVVPVIRPLLPAGSGLSSQGTQIFLRTDTQTLRQIREVIRRLDRAPVNLLISVRNTQRDTAEGSGYSISGRASKGGTSVSVGRPRRDDLRITAGQHSYDTDLDQVSQLRVLESHPAFIATGKALPYYQRSWYLYGAGVSFEDLQEGFYVVPHLQDNRVTLDIRPRSDQLSPTHSGVIDRQSVLTTVSGRLGEWVTIAGTDRSATYQGSGTIYRTTRSSPEERLIQVRVERAD